MTDDKHYLDLAIVEAQRGFDQGGLPIGAVLIDKAGEVIGRGHNQRVQKNDPIAHGEMDCLRNAGRQRSYAGMTLYTTLSPCMMCSGTIVQFGIPRLVIGENETFGGNENFLRERGIALTILDDPRCKDLMQRFIAACPDIWNEDISVD